MNSSFRIILAIAAMHGAGCAVLPWPHRANLTPPVSGIVLTEDQSEHEVVVRVCEAERDRCCAGRSQQTKASTNTAFHVEPVTQFRWLAYVMAHRRFHWCLDFELDGESTSIGPFEDYTLVDTGPTWSYAFKCRKSSKSVTCTEPVKSYGGNN